MGLFKKKPTDFATLNLNARLQPMHRDAYYEKGLNKVLKKSKIGWVDGGGTMLSKEEGPLECDVDITYYKDKEQELIKIIKDLPVVPKGSKLILGDTDDDIDDEHTIAVGTLEGLAIYLNGTELDEKVYKECDVNYVIEELGKLLGNKLVFFSYWTGNKENALYFYGTDYEGMKTAVEPFLADYPLCQKCRVVQIA